MLRSDLCDFNNVYIVVKGIFTVSADERDRDEMNRQVILKNNAPFISCILKINDVLVENAEDLDIVMPMYNLLEYSKNYSKTSASLWNYYRDELTDETNDNNGQNKNVINSKSFKYKTSITGSTYNCEASLALIWTETFVITSMVKRLVRVAQGDKQPVYGDSPESAAFKIKDCKLYVPVVTFSAEIGNKLLEQLKTGFKRTIKWNKYRSEMSNQTKNNNLNYLIDPAFTNVNRLFALTFENEDGKSSFSKYYVPKVEIKDFQMLIDVKPFFEIPVKNKEEAYEAFIEMTKNSNYTTGNLLDYEYFKDHHKLISIDLSKQIELKNLDLKHQINFIARLEENNAAMFFIIEKKEETPFDFSQNSVVVV